MSIDELQRAFRDGRMTPVDALNRCLALIEERDAAINSFVTMNAGAQAEAAASAQRWSAGTPLSEIDGIPFGAKDNLVTAGVLTTWGSLAYATYVPAHDELPLARLRAAGAVLVGKTNTPEFASSTITRNAIFGDTSNPWDRTLTPGGSSGGSASAVAAGLVPFALGTDGGGSTRRPAAHTGIVGLKPSLDRIARSGGFPLLFHDLEVVGVLTRTVADLSPLMRVMASWSAQPATALTIGVALGVNDLPVEPEIRAVTERAARLLAGVGHTVTAPGPLRLDLDEIGRWGEPFMTRGLAAMAEELGERFARADERFKALARLGVSVSAEAERGSAAHFAQFRSGIASVFGGADLLLTPTTAAQPWPLDQVYPDTIDARPAGPRDHAQFTGWINAAALPAISIPAGLDQRGLPIGVQLVGKFGADELVVEVAQQLESALAAHGDWAGRTPPLDAYESLNPERSATSYGS
jgi:aspartyl-tRNA(Asn)/glutamyl-tRNA(Gln) amidotransferase subunit A